MCKIMHVLHTVPLSLLLTLTKVQRIQNNTIDAATILQSDMDSDTQILNNDDA